MARRRSIQHTAPKDEDVATMSLAARYAWAYLPCYADREGRMDDKPFYLKTEIFPIDAVDMESVLQELADRRHIIRYVGGDSRKYIQIRNFLKYQTPHHTEPRSRIPAPSGVTLGVLQDNPEATPGVLQDGPGHWSMVNGPGQWSGSPPSGLEAGRVGGQKHGTTSSGTQSASLMIGPHGYEAPAWDPDGSWRHLTEIWSNAGRWEGGENLNPARKEFIKRVNAENWPAVCAGTDWAVGESLANKDRKHLGVLTMFLREERWKSQVPPMKSASAAAAAHAAATYSDDDAPLPIE